MIFQTLVAIFAFDSVSTYIGIHTGWLQEFNPLVRYLIETIGLAPAMIVIFACKVELAVYLTSHSQRWAIMATRGLLIFYVAMLSIAWARFFL